jgi:hypothetical protein
LSYDLAADDVYGFSLLPRAPALQPPRARRVRADGRLTSARPKNVRAQVGLGSLTSVT